MAIPAEMLQIVVTGGSAVCDRIDVVAFDGQAPLEVLDLERVDAIVNHGFEEGVLRHLFGDVDGDGATADDVARLAGAGGAAPPGAQVDHHDDLGPTAAGIAAEDAHEGISPIGIAVLERSVPLLGGGPQPVAFGFQPVHERYAMLGRQLATEGDVAEVVLPGLEHSGRMLPTVQLLGPDLLVPKPPTAFAYVVQSRRPGDHSTPGNCEHGSEHVYRR